jgi:protein disulfide-isomerase A6
MKPAWDALGDKYASSSSVVVADVDCTVEQDLCSEYDVKGYPTIKYFTAETDAKGDDYQGGRSAEDLEKFVSETLEVKCLLADTAGCSEKETEFMGKWKAKPKEEAKSQLERLSKMMGGSMAPDLKKWVAQRVSILKQLVEA